MSLGKRISLRLKELELTQRQLARKTGLTQPAISKYARNKGKPSYEAIEKLAAVLQVAPGWFFPGEDSDEYQPQGGGISPVAVDAIAFPTAGKFTPGGKFVIGHWFPMREFPAPARGIPRGIQTNFYRLIFNQLVQWTPRSTTLRGVLALNWKRVGNSWVFQLREGVLFHNGELMTAEDVSWTYQQYLQQNPKDTQIEAVEVLDTHLVQIHLKSPCHLGELVMPGIVPVGTDSNSGERIGTGPFQAVELQPGFWQLKKNPDYFLSPPLFDAVEVREYPNPPALEKALASGQVHFAVGLHYPKAGFVARAEPAGVRYHLHFEFNQPLVQNREFRRAVAKALDRKALTKAADLKEALYSSGPFDLHLEDATSEPPAPEPEALVELLKGSPKLRDSVFRLAYDKTAPQNQRLAEAVVDQLNRTGLWTEIGEPAHLRLMIRPILVFEKELAIWETSSPLNFNHYSNPAIDEQIRELRAAEPTDSVDRSQLLKLRRAIQKEMPDIPLFHYESPVTHVENLRASGKGICLLSSLDEIHTWYLEAVEAESEAAASQNASLA